MSKSNAYESASLRHTFLNEALPNIGDAAGLQPSAVAGNLYACLHSGDPGEAGNASTSEAAYPGYARVAIPRSSAGFTVSAVDGIVSFAVDVTFPARTESGVTEDLPYWSIVAEASGAAMILYSGLLTPTFHVDQGEAPTIRAGQIITED